MIYFGCYHWGDYLRIKAKPGPKKIFWCGSDIKAISSLWKFSKLTKHYCENVTEQVALIKHGIEAELLPMIFDDLENYEENFIPSERPNVYLNAHKGREKEYGVDLVVKLAELLPDINFHIYGDVIQEWNNHHNLWFHGRMPEERYNYETKYMQAGLSLSKFGGFSEVVAKSILLGQYPISRVSHPGIDTYYKDHELVALLKELKNKKAANPSSVYWRERLKFNKKVLLQDEQYQI